MKSINSSQTERWQRRLPVLKCFLSVGCLLTMSMIHGISSAYASRAPYQLSEKNTVRDITGKVTDEKGEGLPGVNILIKGSQLGTTTDSDGNFRLNVPNDNTVLVFSFVGFMSREITVGSQSNLNITLETDSKSLEEVVVTALGIRKETKALLCSHQSRRRSFRPKP
jgi:hypothetical protein